MATMTIRTTVAFDPATVARWERLTRRWGVSKSEALCRALEAAEAPLLSREGKAVGPFDQVHSHEAARLFNAVGRAWRFKFDSLIAATAILAGAELATANRDDFEPFVPHGLKLLVW